MTKIKMLMALSTLALLAGCNPIEGTLKVVDMFTYENPASERLIEFCKKWPKDPSCKDVDTEQKTTKIEVGTFDADLEFPSEQKMLLIIKQPSSQDLRLSIPIPRSVKIPEQEGSIYLKGSDIKQKFDIAGNVNTQISESGIRRETEICTYYREEYICRWREGRDRDGRWYRYQECNYESVPYTGHQEVEYYYRTTTKNVALDILNTNKVSMAQFHGSQRETKKVYTYQGLCYGYGY